MGGGVEGQEWGTRCVGQAWGAKGPTGAAAEQVLVSPSAPGCCFTRFLGCTPSDWHKTHFSFFQLVWVQHRIQPLGLL